MRFDCALSKDGDGVRATRPDSGAATVNQTNCRYPCSGRKATEEWSGWHSDVQRDSDSSSSGGGSGNGNSVASLPGEVMVIRVNPAFPQVPGNERQALSIRAGALAALRGIDAALQKLQR